MTTPTHQEAVKVLRAKFEQQRAELYKPEVARGLHLKNADGSFQVSSIEMQFQVWAVGYRTALAATSQVEAATSEAVRFEQRMVAPNENVGPWFSTSKMAYDKFQANPDIGDGFRYEVRALYDNAAPLALPATEQASPLDEVVAFLLGEKSLHGIWFGDQDIGHSPRQQFWWRKELRAALAAQAKPDLSGLKRYESDFRFGMAVMVQEREGDWLKFSDVVALLAHPVAQAKPEGDAPRKTSLAEQVQQAQAIVAADPERFKNVVLEGTNSFAPPAATKPEGGE